MGEIPDTIAINEGAPDQEGEGDEEGDSDDMDIGIGGEQKDADGEKLEEKLDDKDIDDI